MLVIEMPVVIMSLLPIASRLDCFYFIYYRHPHLVKWWRGVNMGKYGTFILTLLDRT